MARLFDHIDLRVTSLDVAAPFYRELLPHLGFSEQVEIAGWLQFESPGEGDVPTAFFGVAEDPNHIPNASRIAFWSESKERVDELAALIHRIGGLDIEGPGYESPGYYAVYFDDPAGNPLEICHRSKRFNAR